MSKNGKCGEICEIFSRVCGYHRPVRNWNRGKQEEFNDRKTFNTSSEFKGKGNNIKKVA